MRVRDLKGIRYLARLLADPSREFHVLDLVATESGRLPAPESSRAAHLPHTGPGDAGEMLDARAKDAYRRRLTEIEDDIEQARAFGDTERAAQSRRAEASNGRSQCVWNYPGGSAANDARADRRSRSGRLSAPYPSAGSVRFLSRSPHRTDTPEHPGANGNT